MSTQPLIWCWWDNCHEFEAGSHNARYCIGCKCKRKQENAVKRLTPVETTSEQRVEQWNRSETAKVGRLETAQKKNQWLYENSSFGHFDLETTNLDASIGMILCGCIKDHGSGEIFTAVSGRDKDGLFDDKEATIALRDQVEKYDYITTWYGTGFDVPYINTRLMIHGERPINQLRHIDLYYRARFNLKLHSNRLQVAAETFLSGSDKTRIVGPIWLRAVAGSKADMDYIVEHCKIDVSELGQLFDVLRGFVNLSAVRWRKFGASY